MSFIKRRRRYGLRFASETAKHLRGSVMQIGELSGIVKQTDLHIIKKELREAGFRDCKRDKELRHAPLGSIAAAPYQKTPYFSDGKGNEYVGDLCRGVKGYEQYEFSLVQLLAPFRKGCDDLSTKKMLIYAKKTAE